MNVPFNSEPSPRAKLVILVFSLSVGITSFLEENLFEYAFLRMSKFTSCILKLLGYEVLQLVFLFSH